MTTPAPNLPVCNSMLNGAPMFVASTHNYFGAALCALFAALASYSAYTDLQHLGVTVWVVVFGILALCTATLAWQGIVGQSHVSSNCVLANQKVHS